MIDAERWKVLGPLLDRALELPSDEQAAWLAELRRSSPDLAAQLAMLLSRESSADQSGFLLAPPVRPPHRDLAGMRLGEQYVLERELAIGGMATVYLARDLRHRRSVAVKVLHPELSALLGLERFRKEIELTAALQHPHILPLFDSGKLLVPSLPGDDAPGRTLLYYVMPYVDGETLRARLAREGRLPIDDAVRFAREVAEVLAYAHSRGVVHRDVKPENILLQNGHALVSDFGIALALEHRDTQRYTGPSVMVGTPQYMAPEQVSAGVIDARADIYALGVVLYELLAGEPPFRGASAHEVCMKVLTAEPKSLLKIRPEVPAHVDAAVRTAIAREPVDRFASASAFADALSAPPADAARRTRRARLVRQFAIALGAIAIAAVTIAITMNTGVMRAMLARRAHASPVATPAEQRSVAVLPFENVGGEPANEYFSDGLTEELIAALSQLRSLRVAARTSSFAFKRDARDVREIARALNVAAVLEGSVRMRGGRIRVTAQLVDAATGLDLWSGTYDERQLAAVFDIQSDLALRIARALEANLSPSERGRLTRRPTESLEAYTLYLKGRFAWSQRNEGLTTAIDYFERAIAIDPQYARAYAGLASAYPPLAVHGYVEPREAAVHARDAARRAVALDDSLAEAHTALAAYLHVFEWDWAGAEREYQHAIALDPGEPTGHLWYGYLLETLGRFDEAIAERKRAADLDPLAPNMGLATVLAKAGHRDTALAAFHDAIARHPGFWQSHESLGELLEAMGNLPEAMRELERAAQLAGGTSAPRAGLARVLARSGKRAEATRLVAELRAEAAKSGNYHPLVATAMFALGDTTAAIAWLETAYRQRHPGLVDIGTDEAYDALRQNGQFQDLTRRVGLGRRDQGVGTRD